MIAEHDGYCSGAECEYNIEDMSTTKIIDMPEEMLGLYDDEDDEMLVTDKLRKKYSYDNERNYIGSNYCDKPETNDERLKEISCCNTDYYILCKIKKLVA